MEIGRPYSTHAFNRIEEEGQVQQGYNNLNLIDLTREGLYTMGVPVILDDDEL